MNTGLAAQFPTVQEQIKYWNTKERLEHERVMDIRAESQNQSTQTGKAKLIATLREALQWNQADLDGFNDISPDEEMLYARRQVLLEAIDSTEPEIDDSEVTSDPETNGEANIVTKPLTQEDEEATSEWFDECSRNWSLRDEGSNDGEGESFASRNA